MKKKLGMIGLTLALTSSLLAGCGSSTKEETVASATPVASAGSTSSPAVDSSKSVTLSYITWDYSDRTKSTDAWIKNLKDKSNITLDMQNVPTDQYNTALKTKFAANDLPDLIKTHGIDMNLVMSEKLEINAEQFADLSDLSAVADFVPSVIKDRKANKANKLYYVPISTNALGVIYNKKVFSDNGIAVPTNIEEFIAACEKLKAAKIAPIAAGFKDAWSTQIIPFIAFGQYVNAKNPEAKTKLADGTLKYADIKADVTKALNVQLDWINKGYIAENFLGTDMNVASQMVGLGKAAMLISGTWQVQAVQTADPKAEIGFFALPLNAKGEKVVVPTSANEGIAVNAKSKNVDAAKKALNEFLGADNQVAVIADLNGIPTNTKVQVSNPFVKAVQDAMASGDVQADWWGGNGLYQASGSAFNMEKSQQNLIAKGITVDQFISDYDAANAKALAK